MASTAAFNALLKLIEEPPAHILFAMATTDPQKVLPTILSRVQRLDLRRVSAPDVAGNVRRICEAEGYTIDGGAVDAIVRAGDGSLRDTQSVLEQVLAFAGTTVTAEAVGQVLGHTPADRVFETVELVAGRDLAGLLGMVQGLLDEGHDLRRFTLDLVQHLRDLLVLQVAPDRPDLVDATDDRRRQLQAQTVALPRESLLRAVGLLAETVVEQRQGSPRLPLELTLARLAVPGAAGDVAGLADRVARLEAAPPVAAPGTVRTAAQRPAPASDHGSREAVPTPEEPDAPARTDRQTPLQARARAHGQSAADGNDPATPEADPPEAVTPEPVTAETAAPEPEPEPGAAQPEPAVPEPEPEPEPVVAEPVAGGNERDLLERNWEGVLELVKNRSRRIHAVFLQADVAGVSRGIVTLRYAKRYASFHAQNAVKGEFADALREAIEQATGLRLKIDVVVEGDDDRRRPMPPSLTPDDARTPVLDDAAEEADVREAEASVAAPAEAARTDELLAEELGAELLEERPAPGAP